MTTDSIGEVIMAIQDVVFSPTKTMEEYYNKDKRGYVK